ncbi:hypothetical protein P280DRAFT_283137 [Massarina eburnea CBS 473.64]|uniref:Uncharacterized protein n=1 Tax=Massarina eburnea CBS 473.64 TaxID=1395130 RepID=A0A6A6S329_9PLEO|nr:hypothetical protein P280DRAFT_283137 [Massarina eburnea CBS 473.64]
MAKRKLTPVVAVAGFLFFVFLYSTHKARDTWRGLPEHLVLSEQFRGNSSDGQVEDPDFANWNPRPNFIPGSPMPPAHNYSTTLVIAKVKDDDIKWMEEHLPKDIELSIWVADDPKAPLHPPKNKGHEVMVYLSWIIDNYDHLPDIAIFLHAHQHAWHNDDLLGRDASQMLQRLNRARIWREGYINMRCSWVPGCPEWMHPGETERDSNKQEQSYLAKSWSELFPFDSVPDVLAQPCSAQFALSRERILAKPHAQYIWYREWLFSTKLSDHLSGRIWEYVWQFVFTGHNIFCPEEQVCFCDQYGSCFGGDQEYKDFRQVKQQLHDRENDLRSWENKAKAITEAQKEGKLEEADQMERPEWGMDEEFKREIERLRPIVEKLEKEAVERGEDPRKRAKELGRKWKEGDGF